MVKPVPKIKMYARANGSFGIRNHLAVISTVACANHVAESVARGIPGSIACTHPYGCDQLGADAELTFRILAAAGSHPNVGGVVVIGLGCEEISAQVLADRIRESRKPVFSLEIQKTGGTSRAIAQGMAFCRELIRIMNRYDKRIPISPEHLVVGLECGGSDYSSGIAANPAVGICSDMFVSMGAKVVFGETTELLGAEHILVRRAKTEQVGDFIRAKVNSIEKAAEEMHVDIRGAQPSPGNIDGGLSTIEEKSLGGICKTGTSSIADAIEYGHAAKTAGLTFMDTPGNDLACTCGLVSGGAHLVLFTTGRGTPMGFAYAPVIKITANKDIAQNMAENIDLDLSPVLYEGLSIEDAGKNIFSYALRVAEGELVAAERLGHREFGFHRIGPTL